jgi:hypothetical protein
MGRRLLERATESSTILTVVPSPLFGPELNNPDYLVALLYKLLLKRLNAAVAEVLTPTVRLAEKSCHISGYPFCCVSSLHAYVSVSLWRVILSKEQFHTLVSINPWFIVAVLLLLPTLAFSQRVLLGVKVAGQITNTFTTPAPDIVHEDKVLFGPMAEINVTHGFALELNALYKPKFNYTNTFFLSGSSGITRLTTDVSAHSWEIPLLLKWHLPIEHNLVFLGAGLFTRGVAGTTHTFGFQSTGLFTPPTPVDTRTSDGDIVNHWTYGPVVAGGVDLRAGKFHFQPELRYTRWNNAPFPFGMRFDEIQALIGIAVGK